MDLNKTYQMNIINQTIKGRGLFLVVERFNDHSSQHFQNYYRKLRNFNQCSEWFQKLDYPVIEVGSVILAKINKKASSWSRGIISRCSTIHNNTLQSQLYLIDTQRIVNLDSCSEFRFCPPKFASLVLPTYTINVDFDLDNDDFLQGAIEMLITKNQCGDISFSFIPQSITSDNIYSGELIVNYEIDNSIITLEKFIKNVSKRIKLNDLRHKQCGYLVFDPLAQLNSLSNVFIPKDFSKEIFSDLNQTSSFSELNHSNGSLESDDSSSLDSEYYSFSDDTTNKIIITHNNCNTTEKLKPNSSFYSSVNNNNLSTDSFEKIQSECFATINCSSTKSNNLSTEQIKTSYLDFEDENNLNSIISTVSTVKVSENNINTSTDSFENTLSKCTSTLNFYSTDESINLSTEQIQNSSLDFEDEHEINSLISTATTVNLSENNGNSSTDSFENTCSKYTATLNSCSTNESISLSTEKNQNSPLDFDDESKFNPIISTVITVNLNSTSSDDTNIPIPNTKLESKPNSCVNNHEHEVDPSNYETNWRKIRKNYFNGLIKMQKTSYQKNDDFIIDTQKIKESSKTPQKTLISYGDGTELWWTDSDDDSGESGDKTE